MFSQESFQCSPIRVRGALDNRYPTMLHCHSMKPQKINNGLLSTREAALLAHVTVHKIKYDVRLGRIKAEPRDYVPQRLKFRRSEVARYAKTIKRDS